MKIFNNILGISALFAAIILGLTGPTNTLAATSPTLGASESYSVLAGSIVTNTGATTMPGNLGISPSVGVPPHFTGFPPGVVGPPGAIHDADADAGLAQADNTTVFGVLSAGSNAACNVTYAGTQDLAGLSLIPGVYCADVFQLSGTLTLNAQGDANGVWIFRTAAEAAALTTTPGVGANVQFLDGIGSPCNVWWKVASSATIGSGTAFVGNILALTSISFGTGATLSGRAMAQTGAVTLDTNIITNPICAAVTPPGGTPTGGTPAGNTLSSGTSTDTGSSSTAVPSLPDTGAGNSTSWKDIAILAGIFMASMLVVITQRKKTT
ncbi:MAG: ice-binding family protein [bacterium]|nr:ice-binding family protein [bacterium]